MDRKRPQGREKNVTEGTTSVYKRGDGLGTGGPTGQGGADSQRNQGASGQGAGRPARASGSFGGYGGGGIKMKPSLLIIIVVVCIALYFFMGQGQGGGNSSGVLQSSTPNVSSAAGSGQGSGGGLNTTVSNHARDKRTQILGSGKDTVTLMIYMCGTDLESRSGAATADLQEMLKAKLNNPKFNIILETGGTQQWQNNVISSKGNQRYKITADGLELLEDNLGKKSMVNPNTLSDFIQYSAAHYPANRYALVFWDHGGGTLSGFGYDQLFPNDSMTLDEIAVALKNGGCTFDFIGFDACLMATLETSLAMEPYADYLLASEETEPGGGWYYTNWLTAWAANTSLGTLEVGKAIVDDFIDYTQQGMTTLSLIDLAEVAGVVPESLREFSQSTAAMIKEGDYAAVAQARGNAREFARSAGIDQVDLIKLAQDIGTEESIAFANALKGCVKYNRTCAGMTHANGVSIYFPYGKPSSLNSVLNTYDKMGMDEEYSGCIKDFANLQLGGQIASAGSSSTDSLFGSLLGSLLSGGGSAGGSAGSASGGANSAQLIGTLLEAFLQAGDYNSLSAFAGEETPTWVDKELITSSAQQIAGRQFDPSQLKLQRKNGGSVIQLAEEQWELVQTIELNVFIDDGKGFIDLGLDNVFSFDDDGDLVADYDNTWLTLNGHVVAYYMMSEYRQGDSYLIQGRIPAMLNGQLVDIMVEFTDQNPNGQVLGARIHYTGDSLAEAKGLLEIRTGDKIDFVCDYYTYDQKFVDNYYLGDPLTVSGTLTVSNMDIGNAKSVATFRFTDIYGNAFWAPSM